MPRAILLIDAGFRATGYAVILGGAIQATGCIETEKVSKKLGIRCADDDMRCCQQITRELLNVIDAHSVAGIICELPGGGARGARPIKLMAQASAIVAAVIECRALAYEYVTPRDVKMITGKSTATKEEVQAVVMKRWPRVLPPPSDDTREHIADAIAAYIAAEHGNVVRLLNA